MGILSAFLPSALVDILSLPFKTVFRVPNMRLRFGELRSPNYILVVTLLILAAYAIFAGVFYYMIISHPSFGHERV
jgi:hypothetical protein